MAQTPAAITSGKPSIGIWSNTEKPASTGRQFPVDVSESMQPEQYGTGPRMTALEQAGLVRSSNTLAVASVIIGPGGLLPVKRYEATAKEEIFSGASRPFRETGLLLRERIVDSIVKWMESLTTRSYSQTEVTYSHKISDHVSWAKQAAIQVY